MKKYVPLNKRSKKEQREYYSRRRRTWGELNPVTRSVPGGKKYNRKKEKQRTGREIRNGFDAGLLYLSNVVSFIPPETYRFSEGVFLHETIDSEVKSYYYTK